MYLAIKLDKTIDNIQLVHIAFIVIHHMHSDGQSLYGNLKLDHLYLMAKHHLVSLLIGYLFISMQPSSILFLSSSFLLYLTLSPQTRRPTIHF